MDGCCHGRAPRVLHYWYMDDGQAICRPEHVDTYLAYLDAAMAYTGGYRGEVPDAKSTVRLVGHPIALATFAATRVADTWVTDRVRRTCRVGEPNSDVEVLGVVVGAPEARNAQFMEKVHQLEALHDSLSSLDDAPVEMVLGRKCVDVSRVMYLMRMGGLGP